jgi:hypothetical protein
VGNCRLGVRELVYRMRVTIERKQTPCLHCALCHDKVHILARWIAIELDGDA